MEELREKALNILDFNFKMVNKEEDALIRKIRINDLYGAIEFALNLNLLTMDEWKFLYNVLCVYETCVFVQNEINRTTQDLINEVVEKYNLDYYKVLEEIDKALDVEFGFSNRKDLDKEILSKELYETILLSYREEYEK